MAIVSLVSKLGGGGDQNNSAVFSSNAAEFYSWMKASVSFQCTRRGRRKMRKRWRGMKKMKKRRGRRRKRRGGERG